jgi:hypothetical protein
VRPQGRPQDEGDAAAAGAAVRGGEGAPAGYPRDHRAVGAGSGQRADLALGDMAVRERQLPGGPAAAVADVAADQRELDVLALVQRRERANAVRRRVVGDEEDRLQRSASS